VVCADDSYVTLVGTASSDWGFGLAADSAGNVYVSGYVGSGGIAPQTVTVGTSPFTTLGNNANSVVFKLDSTGTAIF